MVTAQAKVPFDSVQRIKGRYLLLAEMALRLAEPRFLGCLTCAWLVDHLGPVIRFLIRIGSSPIATAESCPG